MRPHPYLRAYMAGIVVPTIVLLIFTTVYSVLRFSAGLPDVLRSGAPFERIVMFPMAVVPNLWGAWNLLHQALGSRVRLSLGAHGALLPILLLPAGVMLARAFDVFNIPWGLAITVLPIGMMVYYLAWKYFVGFLNEELGIA
jgi:hypothetical protein